MNSENNTHLIPPPQPTALPKKGAMSTRTLGQMRIRAEFLAHYSRCRAEMARFSLMNLSTLSQTEAALLEVAPSGKDRYKLVIDAVAMAEAKTIAAFGGENWIAYF